VWARPGPARRVLFPSSCHPRSASTWSCSTSHRLLKSEERSPSGRLDALPTTRPVTLTRVTGLDWTGEHVASGDPRSPRARRSQGHGLQRRRAFRRATEPDAELTSALPGGLADAESERQPRPSRVDSGTPDGVETVARERRARGTRVARSDVSPVQSSPSLRQGHGTRWWGGRPGRPEGLRSPISAGGVRFEA